MPLQLARAGSREQGCSSPDGPFQALLPEARVNLDLCMFMGFHLLGGLPDFWWCPPLCDLPLARNLIMLPLPQIPTLGHVAGACLPVTGLGVDSQGCLLCLDHTPSYLLNSQFCSLQTWAPVLYRASRSDMVTDGPCGLLSAFCLQDPSLYLLSVQTHHTGKGITPLFHRYFPSACSGQNKGPCSPGADALPGEG